MGEKKAVVASDKYKGCLTSPEVCQLLAEGFRGVAPDWTVETVPQADGGEGTVTALVEALDGKFKKTEVEGPRDEKVEATWGLLRRESRPDAAVIEMAAASGLALLDPERQNPFKTSTYGTGQLIRAAARAGAEEILLGIGGSATVDGGLGAAQALGFTVLDSAGKTIGKTGGDLGRAASIDDAEVPPEVKELEINVACDVTNPLLGESGAARVYGPQKGAEEQMVPELENNLENWADVLENYAGRSLRKKPGAGAAGGLGFGLVGFLDASLTGGAQLVAELTDLSEHLATADLLITGEGSMDAQTAYGKSPQVVAERGSSANIDLIVGVAGAQAEGYRDLYENFDLLVGLPRRPMSLEESLDSSQQLLEDWGRDIARLARKFLEH